MDQLLGNQQMPSLHKGEEIDTKITAISKKAVMFDLGAKAYAVLGDRELKEISTYLPYLKVGDTVKVRVIAEESKEGYPVVSMSRFFEKGKWNILIDKKEKEEEKVAEDQTAKANKAKKKKEEEEKEEEDAEREVGETRL